MDTLSNAYDFAFEHTADDVLLVEDETEAARVLRYSVGSICDGRSAYDAVYEPVNG